MRSFPVVFVYHYTYKETIHVGLCINKLYWHCCADNEIIYHWQQKKSLENREAKRNTGKCATQTHEYAESKLKVTCQQHERSYNIQRVRPYANSFPINYHTSSQSTKEQILRDMVTQQPNEHFSYTMNE